ncbi:hypothetical protein WICANDRAFT_78576 [Wickerhamomyces anomalus NRRL Y-366-8]|uniref:Alpha/beta hydrolase fold-3 domain-containing protein n=1 Tax=Wickerhamomyces anomalus (strain ATCC 58044 / CBS 1984 / NCYC 433 / NRRL Y-366-8) TaxID=683960 RepID=A0A1E3P3N1_WICAA|nr:uncharacterized protein WICANDRAFT_78576 [Wickerhamomyces anomalus NRRL Y-366-8]ODQ59953.1 hypothetical protein WICANDRAFT_78576 [Wickerhamomyces anomalus NRRL Y-366-8]
MKITLIPIFLSIIHVTLSAPALTFPTPKIGEDIVKYTEAFLSIFITLLDNNFPVVQIGNLVPDLSLDFNMKVVEPFAKDLPNYNTEFPVEGLDQGKVKWLVEAENRTKDDPVIIYSHGGGYVFGVFPFFPFLFTRIYQETGNNRLSILMLDYKLSLEEKYPYQLGELALVYNKIAESSNNIILAGDSAGVHLSLNLLRHSKFPVSGVNQVSAGNITGGLFFSPWVNMYVDDTTGSHEYNMGKDILTPKIIREGGKQFVPSSNLLTSNVVNFYNDTEANWKELVPKNVLATYGGHEIMETDDKSWFELAGLSGDQIFEDKGAIHDAVIFTPDLSAVVPKAVEFLKTNY